MNKNSFFSQFTTQNISIEQFLEKGFGSASSNIALIKYWGKRDLSLNLPLTSSLSLSLGDLGTQTTLSLHSKREADQYSINGVVLLRNEPTYQRLYRFLSPFRPKDHHFELRSVNTVPTKAGLASSASGYAALAGALDALFAWNLDEPSLSRLARLGSGSASRSVLKEGFALWNRGERADGMDCYAKRIDQRWSSLRWVILPVDFSPKKIGSKEAMQQTFATSPFGSKWVQRVAQELEIAVKAISEKDFAALGAVMERNAFAMHALMRSAKPRISYFQPQTIAIIQWIYRLRSDGGLPVFMTMDAGPNIKLLLEEKSTKALKTAIEQESALFQSHQPIWINPWERVNI